MSRPGTGRDRLSLIIAVIAVLVLIAGVVVSVVAFSHIREDRAVDQARNDAVRAAEQFALRMDAIELGDFKEYKKSVAPLLTTKERTVFEQQFKQFEEVFEQAQKQGLKTSRAGKGEIIFSAATDADRDSATVLVAHDSTVPGQAQKLHFRWQLGMREVEGEWLVDDFTPVE